MVIKLWAWLPELGRLALQRSFLTQQQSTLPFHDNRASPVSWDPSIIGIPAANFPSNHACLAAREMNQARTRTAGNTLLMRVASNL